MRVTVRDEVVFLLAAQRFSGWVVRALICSRFQVVARGSSSDSPGVGIHVTRTGGS